MNIEKGASEDQEPFLSPIPKNNPMDTSLCFRTQAVRPNLRSERSVKDQRVCLQSLDVFSLFVNFCCLLASLQSFMHIPHNLFEGQFLYKENFTTIANFQTFISGVQSQILIKRSLLSFRRFFQVKPRRFFFMELKSTTTITRYEKSPKK